MSLEQASELFRKRNPFLHKNLQLSIDSGVKKNPDALAESQSSAKKLDIPVDLAERQSEEINKIAKSRDIYKRLKDTKHLKKIFENPDFAAIAHDDLDSLIKTEKSVEGVTNDLRALRGPEPTVGSYLTGLGVGFTQGLEKIRQGIRLQWADLISSERMREDAMNKFDLAETETLRFDPEFKSSTARGIYSGFSSITRQGPALAASIYFKQPSLVLGYMGQSVEAESYAKYRSRGATPKEALIGGMSEAAVEVATELMPMGFLVKKFGKTGASEFLTGMLAREIPGEQIATIVQDAIDTAIANPDKTWGDYIAERPDAAYQTLIATLVQTGIVGGVSTASSYGLDMAQAEIAVEDQAILEEQIDAAKESKLRNRSPEEYKRFLDEVLGAEDEVYIPIDAVNTLFQSETDLKDTLPEELQESIEESLGTGNDVAIKKSDYLTYLTDYHEELASVVRSDIDGMTAQEAEAWTEQGNEQFEEEAEKILIEMELETDFQESADKVQGNIKSQLTRFTPEVAEKYASLHKAFSVVMADRLNILPEQVYERFGLKVGEVKEMESYNQSGLIVAARNETGETIKGEKGQIHAQMIKREKGFTELGFMDQNDKFYTREEALDLIRETKPDFQSEKRMGELDSQDLFQDKRGAISFKEDGAIIALLEDADLSTFLHESGHFFFEAYKEFAGQSPEIQKDMDALLKFAGVKDLETWNGMTLEQRREGHEKVARAFESYLFEGTAPSIELEGLFSRFKSWLLNVYKNLRNLNVNLTQEVRQVFDRMLATAEQIREKSVAAGYDPIFQTIEESGMTPKEWNEFQNLNERQKIVAQAELDKKSINDIKWLSRAKSKALKEAQAKVKDKRAFIAAQATDDVSRESVYQAEEFIKKGNYIDEDGNPQKVKIHKIDKAEFDELHPNLKLRGMTAKGGMPSDLIATQNPQWEFSSGEHMIEMLLARENKAERIARLTDERMLEVYGDINNPEALERAAQEAVHNAAHIRFLHTEFKALAKSAGINNVAAKAAKAYAKRAMANKKIRDITPYQYQVAAKRAGREAEKAMIQGDRVSAAEHKRAQLLSTHFYKESVASQESGEKMLKYFKKLLTRKGMARIEPEYKDQINALLESKEFKRVTNKELENRQSMLQWIESQIELGFEPIVDPAALDKANHKNYRDMTFAEMQLLHDQISNIEHLGRAKKKFLQLKDKRAFKIVIADLKRSINELSTSKTISKGMPADKWGKTQKWQKQLRLSHRKLASLVREVDGGKDAGPMWNLITRGMSEAGDNQATMTMEDARALNDIFKDEVGDINKGGIPFGIRAKARPISGTDLSMTKEAAIMFVMNMGNEGNRQRLLSGGIGQGPITEQQSQAIIDSLTKGQMDVVQNVLDYIETKKELIRAQELKLTGVEPVWVDPIPIVSKHGTYRGGYFHIRYDNDLSTMLSKEAAYNARSGMSGAHGRYGTSHSYIEERANKVRDKALMLNFSAISEHLQEVNHRLAYQEWLVDSQRAMKAVDDTVRDNYGVEYLREINDTITDIAKGEKHATDAMQMLANHFRIGTTIVGLGWRITTALIQPAGLSNSWARIGTKHTYQGIKEYFKHPIESAKFAEAKSKMMRARAVTMQREVTEVLNTIRAGETHAKYKASMFYLIQKMQRTVDIPTWHAAYQKSLADQKLEMAENQDQRDTMDAIAVAVADQTVKDTQASGLIGDLSRIQRGGAYAKMFTNFYSYFAATWNLNAEVIGNVKRGGVKSFPQAVMDLLIINAVPAMFAMALDEMLRNECDGEVECLGDKFLEEQVRFGLGLTIPTRLLPAIPAFFGMDTYGYKGPVGLTPFVDIGNLMVQTSQLFNDWEFDSNELDEAFWKALARTSGALMHQPFGQGYNTVTGLWAWAEGDVEGLDIPRAAIKGRPR